MVIVDQEGTILSNPAAEKAAEVKKWFDAKVPEFIKELQHRCTKRGIRYDYLGYDQRGFHMFIVSRSQHILGYDSNGVVFL